jgi:anti-sigma factor (TIGR02949 family)
MMEAIGMIRCEEVLARLWEFLDGELPPEDEGRLQRHLEVCGRCYPQYDFRRAYLEYTRRLAEREVAPPDLRKRIFRHILEEEHRTWGGAMSRLLAASLALLLLPAGVRAQSEWKTDFSRHTVPLEEIVPGGPPKDGIPAIDDPQFVSVDEADRWLSGREPVIVVRHVHETRVYPYQILIFHEIVNDIVGGRPLAVTYCPLCNTALVFDRRHDGRVLDFGTTGRLRHSDMVMYDRQTESWWQQATGEAILGELAGDRLEPFPAQTMSWNDVRRAYPDGRVLSRETGHDRPYGRNPYEGYDRTSGPIRSFFRSASTTGFPPWSGSLQ